MKRTSVRHMGVRALIALAALAAVALPVHPDGKEQAARSGAALTNDSYRPFLINNVFNYYGNNGDGSYNPFSRDNEGFEFPRGSDKHIIFEDGLLWGGFHKGRATPKVGGSVYRHALQPGPLLTSGSPTTDPVAANPSDPRYRMYSVRPDVRPDIPFANIEALLTAGEVPYIGRYESVSARSLYDSYCADWNAWPASLGAPFTDVDRNGMYDPAVDIPGQPGADQTLWYVANDMDIARTQSLAGSPPVGLEIQRTIWGYRRSGGLGNAIFIGTILINKSGAPVDSMFLMQWADTDLGEAGDDLAGCDTTLDLCYTYNGFASDAVFGTAVPAGGFAFLQGPMVPGAPTDTAHFLSARRPGFHNLRLSAFEFFTDGLMQFADATSGGGGDVQWYRLMNGLGAHTGAPYIDPVTGLATKICVTGDPVNSTNGGAGWVDGTGYTFLRDRRMCMSSGPFTLAPGDTQQVVVVALAAQGADRIASINVLRSSARSVQTAFRRSITGRPMPAVSCAVQRDSADATITCRIDARNDPLTAASVSLTTYAGAAVAQIQLADDGLHDDGAVGDGIWGGITRVGAHSSGLKGDATLTYADGRTVAWESVLDRITTARLSVVSFGVTSDNINSDGVANPGENIRYTFVLRNDSPVALRLLTSRPEPFAKNGTYIIPSLPGHAAFRPRYDGNDAATYFVFEVPAGYTDSTMRVAMVTADDSLNIWRDTLVFPVQALPVPVYTTPLRHISGRATGAYTVRIADPALVKHHLYVIRGVDSASAIGSYSVKDSTTGLVVLGDHAPPDVLGHMSPVVDGFKVLPGTIETRTGMKSWEVPQGIRRFTPIAGRTDVGLEGFSTGGDPIAYNSSAGTIGAAAHFNFGGIGTSLPVRDCHTVMLKLAAVNNVALWDPRSVPADTNYSRAYRYLCNASAAAAASSFIPWIINTDAGFPYQDYNHGVPFSAWDMDVEPPMRLAVGHLENNAAAGLVDGRYWPGYYQNVDNSQVLEFAFIFSAPYTDTPDPALAVNLSNNAGTPLMWVMTCARRAEDAWPGSDQFKIVACAFPTSDDAWVFDPSALTGARQGESPASFALLQNYPNPFNPVTTIRYELPAQSEVTITVYDVLGRAVKHLVRDVQPAGSHVVSWHADTDGGSTVASGVYFYRYTAARSDRSGQYEQTMKMILLK